MKPVRTALLCLALTACATASAPQTSAPSVGLEEFLAPIRVNPASPAEFTAYCDEVLARGQAMREAIEGARGPATIAVDFQQFDDLTRVIGSGFNDAGLLSETHPNADTRAAGEACIQRLSAFSTEVGLSRPIYDRLVAIDASGDTDATRLALTRAIEEYQRSGVDKDEATRARVTELQNEITEVGLNFARNIREDETEVTFPSVAALAGLPDDYIAQHQPGPDGLVHITTNYPDVGPILNYATREDTRRQVYVAFRNRAYPQNEQVLRDLLVKRYELARLLGQSNYAELITEDKMIRTPERAQSFIDELAGVARPAATRDFQRQIDRLRRIEPNATTVPQWSGRLCANLGAPRAVRSRSPSRARLLRVRQCAHRHVLAGGGSLRRRHPPLGQCAGLGIRVSKPMKCTRTIS